MDAIIRFLQDTGFYLFSQDGNWRCLIMLGIACVLLYLGIVKKFEPLLLVPIAFGMLITNLPGANMFHEIFFAGGHIHWDLIGGQPVTASLLADLHSQGVAENVLAPYIQQLMTAAQTTFSPEMVEQAIAAVTEESGAAITVLEAQLQALVQAEQAAAYYGMTLSDITITPGLVDILYLGVKLGIYPCLIFMGVGAMTDFGPLIANPKSLLLGAAAQLGIFITFVALLVPSAAPLIACLMLGNLFKECGVTERLSKTVQNELINIVTIFLGVSVGATATGTTFLSLQTIKIMAMGVVAFSFGTAGGVLLAKFMNLFLKEKINPLIGSAGVSAVPMAARVSQMVGQKYNPGNFLLMHAMGPNVAGVIGSAVAAGILINIFG